MREKNDIEYPFDGAGVPVVACPEHSQPRPDSHRGKKQEPPSRSIGIAISRSKYHRIGRLRAKSSPVEYGYYYQIQYQCHSSFHMPRMPPARP